MLPVNEIFETLQGEATWTGTPSVFVRLQGCEVGCPWCDTKHTWPLDPKDEIGVEAMLEKIDPAPTYAKMEERDLMAVLGKLTSQHIVLTGGEPCDHDLTELTDRLTRIMRSSQIETSGTREIACSAMTWVTLSPKIGMPGQFEVLDGAVERANEIKMPVGKPADIDKLDQLLRRTSRMTAVWLQPLSQSEKATKLCIEVARQRNWRVSLQTHKFAGLR